MKKILFRADAKPSIGIGDLMSILHLSFYLNDFECFFLTQATVAAKDIMAEYNPKNIFWLDEDADIISDITTINKLIDEYAIDILLFEITERKLTDYVGITNGVSKACINFDGYVSKDIKLLINWDAAAYKYYERSKFPDTKFLLGSRYVILPKAFYSKEIRDRTYPAKRNKILIAMGGADELDFTSKVVDAVAIGGSELTIIVGAGYENMDKLKDSVGKKSVPYEIKVNVRDMLSEYMKCDFAIGAGGLTSSELVASRTPCALIATYEHQVSRCEYFDKEGWARYIGFRISDSERINDALQNFCPKFDGYMFDTFEIINEIRKL